MLLSEDESWPTSSCMLAPAPDVTEATAAKEWLVSSLLSLFWPAKTKNRREMAGRGRRCRAALSKLRARTATPSLLLWVSCSHAAYESEWISKGWGRIFCNGRETTVARAELPIVTCTQWKLADANTFAAITWHTILQTGFQVMNKFSPMQQFCNKSYSIALKIQFYCWFLRTWEWLQGNLTSCQLMLLGSKKIWPNYKKDLLYNAALVNLTVYSW